MSIQTISNTITSNQKQVKVQPMQHHEIRSFVDFLFRVAFVQEATDTLRPPFSLQLSDALGNFIAILFELYNDVEKAQKIANEYFNQLPSVLDQLYTDAKATYNADPASTCISEVFNAYPGFYAIALYRFAHLMTELDIPLIPRIISTYAQSKTGIDIHPKAKIGSNFVIDHGTGIVIGETTIIGNHVTLYQGVTLGAISVAKELSQQKRHPTIEDHVIIYANATILGGDTTIGHHSIIGGNTWITHSLAPHTIAYQNANIIIRDKAPLPEPINFVI